MDRSISIVVLASHAAEGGTANYTNALKRSLEKLGHKVHRMAVYRTPNDDPDGFDQILVPDDNPSLFAKLRGPLEYVRAIRQLRPDVIMGVMPMANVLAGVGTFFTPAAGVATHHSPYETDSRLMRRLDRLLGQAGRFQSIVSVSNAVAESYASHPAAYLKHMTVIPNGIPALAPDADRATIRAKYGVGPGRPFGLMAGRLADQKNVLRAVEAMASVDGADFLLSGKGPLEDALRDRIETLGLGNRVRLIGLVSKQDLTNLMYECDAFIQVSLYEGQSVALLEAAFAGAPLVVSAIPTQMEVVTTPEGLAGHSCDPEDPNDIARAIRLALFDADAQASVAAGRRYLQGNIRSELETHAEYVRMIERVAAAKDQS